MTRAWRRVALIAALGFLLLLFTYPYRQLRASTEGKDRARQELEVRQKERAELERRRAELLEPTEIERRARDMGFARPNEVPFVVVEGQDVALSP